MTRRTHQICRLRQLARHYVFESTRKLRREGNLYMLCGCGWIKPVTLASSSHKASHKFKEHMIERWLHRSRMGTSLAFTLPSCQTLQHVQCICFLTIIKLHFQVLFKLRITNHQIMPIFPSSSAFIINGGTFTSMSLPSPTQDAGRFLFPFYAIKLKY